ncbi:MAG: PilT protein domain protein [Parcubacteria group bacterium Gr01-1014_30]|nr:MAG: PilT protein domain protein [Parcubacteria group bacterium Gr01-1014_30]
MEVVIDSHAFFWFLSENPKLSRKAERLVKDARSVIVPSIVLMEILYLLEKNNLSFRFVEFLGELKLRKYTVWPLDLSIIAQTLAVDSSLEMHDRIIVATAEIAKAPIISRDRQIRDMYSNTIW